MKRAKAAAALFLLSALRVAAQTAPSEMDHGGMQGMEGMAGMEGMQMNPASQFLMRESSGTAFQPSAWQMPMIMTHAGKWNLMWMGQAFVVDTQQSGPRGGDKFYSTNWGMLSAVRDAGGGSLMLRSMVSLEPATISERRYPLLFQTGETAFGKPLVDAQHPHDLFMEVSMQYAHPLGETGTWNIYYAPVGEPALGPVAYPHRASAMELPQAALGHHWEDSSHIADNVITGGLSVGKARIEASGFYGREPDENRWNFDFGAMDSWSARLSFFPSKNWAGQISTSHLHHPEAAHAGNVVRTTASVEYAVARQTGNSWATSLIWGQDYKQDESRAINAVTAETAVPFGGKNFLTGRYEWSQRDELFENDPNVSPTIANRAYNVHAFTAGYTRDVEILRGLQSGVGANVSTFAMDDALKAYYGAHPWGVEIYLRLRVRSPDAGR